MNFLKNLTFKEIARIIPKKCGIFFRKIAQSISKVFTVGASKGVIEKKKLNELKKKCQRFQKNLEKFQTNFHGKF